MPLAAVIEMDIVGLGIVMYSPFAVAHIAPGQNYLEEKFTSPADVAQHVNSCRLSAFCTASPGTYRLVLNVEAPAPHEVKSAELALRLAAEVRDESLCFRDLYDLLEWVPACPPDQVVRLPNGFYLITLLSSAPPSGVLGDDQEVRLFLEAVPQSPNLAWRGVPVLEKNEA